LRESQVRLGDYASLASDWFWEQDAEPRFVGEGTGAPPTLGASSKVAGKQRWEIASNRCDAETWAKHRRDLLARRTFHDFCYQQIDPDGRIAYLSVSGVPMYDALGTFVGYRGIGRDITTKIEAGQCHRLGKRSRRRDSRTARLICSDGPNSRIALHAPGGHLCT
jgi:PAS domain S-box-containing protein